MPPQNQGNYGSQIPPVQQPQPVQPVKNGSPKLNTVLLLIIIILLGVGLFMFYQKKEVNDGGVAIQNKTQIEQQNYIPNQINQAESLFKDWIIEEGNSSEPDHKYSDYRIDKVTFVSAKATSTAQEKENFYSSATDDAYIVSVNYAVKPLTLEPSWWVAGNGNVESNGWVTGKSLFVTIDKVNGVYKIIGMGTGL